MTSARDDDYAADPVPDSSRVGWPLIFFAEMGIATALFFLQITSIIALTCGSRITLIAIGYSSIISALIGFAMCRVSIDTGFGMNLLARRVLGYRGAFLFSLIFGVNAFVFFAVEARIMGSSIAPMIPLIPVWIVLPVIAFAMTPLVWFGMRLLARFQLVTFLLYAVLMAAALITSVRAPAQGRDWLHYLPTGAPALVPGLIAAIGTMNSVVFIAGLQTADYARFVRRTEIRLASIFLGIGFQLFCFTFSGLLGLWFSVRYLSTNPGLYFVTMLGGWGTLFAVATQLRINLSNLYSGSMAFLNIFRQLGDVVVSRKLMVLVFSIAVSLALMFDLMSNLVTALNVIGLFTTCFTCLVLLDVYGLHPHSRDDEHKVTREADWHWSAIASLVIATAAGSLLQTGAFGAVWVSMASLAAALGQSVLHIAFSGSMLRSPRHEA